MDHSFRVVGGEYLHDPGNDSRPASLVARAQAPSVVAVEILLAASCGRWGAGSSYNQVLSQVSMKRIIEQKAF